MEAARLYAENLDSALIRLVLRDAVRAPSSHNTQPWLFHVENGSVELWADRSRSLPIVDPRDRELTISCGAALHHLRVAIRRSGYTPEVERLIEPDRPDLLARVSIREHRPPSEDDLMLAESIPRRHTNRGPFLPSEVKPHDLLTLREAAEREGAALIILPESRRHAAAVLVADGDRAQWQDTAFRRELAKWLRGNHDAHHRDGLPGYALGLGDAASALAPLLVRTFDRGDGTAARDAEVVEGVPILAVLVTAGDTARNWLCVGEALSHVLLRATAFDLAASFLNQPIEVDELRPRIAELIDYAGVPQLLLRIGYPAAPALPTPRREVDDVVR